VVELVAEALRRDPRRPGDLVVDAPDRARHAEAGDVARSDYSLGEHVVDEPWRQLQVALVADPALLPLVVELAIRRAEVPDEVHREGGMTQQPGQTRATTDDQRCGRMADHELLLRGGRSPSPVGGDAEHVL